MQNLHLKNFRKSVDSKIKLADFTLLIGKNNSGKSNVAKSLLLFSDYLTSDSISKLPLDGPNSIYHKIGGYQDLLTFYDEEREGSVPGSYLRTDERQPKISIIMAGGAKLTLHLKDGQGYGTEVIVDRVIMSDSDDLEMLKIETLELNSFEVTYQIELIQNFLSNHQSGANNNAFGNRNIKKDLESRLIRKKDDLNLSKKQADRIRLQTDIQILEEKIKKIEHQEVSNIPAPNIKSIYIDINQSIASKWRVIDLFTDYFPKKWSFSVLDPKNNKSEDIKPVDNIDIDDLGTDSELEMVNLDEDELETGQHLKIDLYAAYKEYTANIGRFISLNSSTILFSPVNRYAPYREYINTSVYSQVNHIDIIKDIYQLLNFKGDFSLRADEKSFLNRWLREFEISDGEIESDLLKIEKQSNLGFSINVFTQNSKYMPGNNHGYINMVDKGYGSGQVLAIILKIIAANNATPFNKRTKGQINTTTVILEEPESNLHPNYQSKLVDLLWDAQHKFSLNFIIECHSEYMIRRLQVLVKNGDLTPDDIAINYFDKSGVTIIEIDQSGYLKSNFGSGFTDESSKLAMDLL